MADHPEDDVVKGWEFKAALQLRTPLAVLKRHGELHTDRTRKPPAYAAEAWHGHWSIKTKTWKELGGADLPEWVPSVATDLGEMPDGGESYFRFLVAVRTIAEDAALSDEQKRSGICQACERPEWSHFAEGHGGPDAVIWKISSAPQRSRRR